MANGLTPKQQRFVEEYLVDLNGTQAAIRAGYSEKTAGQQAWDHLKKPEIQRAVQAALNERAKATEITVERVLHELAAMAFSNMANYMTVNPNGDAVLDLSELTPDQAAAIQEITTEVYMEGRGEDAEPVKKTKLKLHPRQAALDSLGKYLALFVNRHQHEGVDGAPLSIPIEFVKADVGDG